MSRKSLAAIRAVLGLAQGALLYVLYNVDDAKVWPGTDAQVFAPLVLAAVFVPTLAVAGLGNLRLPSFAIWIGGALAAIAALGAYDIFHDPIGGPFGFGSGAEPARVPSLPLWLAAAAGLFISHVLIVSGDADRAVIAKYPQYFDVAWKHAVQAALAGAFAVALWVLLFLGAALFYLIGITFFEELLRKPWFSIPVTTLALAAAVHVTDVQAGIVRGVRTLALTLLSWLLPLFALITAGFLVTLLFTGLGPLWNTRHAADLVLVTAAALIVLINAAYQDGRHPAALVLRYAAVVAAVALTPLVVIAGYAVFLRVNQYGWTPDRIAAAACVVVAACYAAGYGLAAAARGPWLQRIEVANVVTSVVILAAILALFSPAADPLRISVADQVARLEDGRTPVQKFDFRFLRFRGGRYGMAALDRLRQLQGGPDAARIAAKATAALALKNRYDAPENAPVTPTDRAANITVVYPKGQSLPAAFLQQESERYDYCLSDDSKCDAVMVDLDGDGAAEILLSVKPHGYFRVYKETGGKWRHLGALDASSGCNGVRDALLAGNFELIAPAFKDVKAAGAILQVRPEHKCP
jgi:hypothetical protein